MTDSFKRFALVVSLALAGIVITPYVSYAGGGVATGGSAGGMPVLTVYSRHFQIQMPTAVTAGYVSIRYVFNGGVWSSVGLIRLNPGVTAEQVLSAGRSGNQGAIHHLGVSLGTVGSPTGAQLIANLQPGQYVIGDVEQTGKNTFIAAGRGLTVLPASGQPRPAPVASVYVGMINFKFHMPSTIRTGMNTFEVMNMGTQTHELLLFKLAPGKTVADVMSALRSRSGPPPGRPVGGLFDLAPAQTVYLVQSMPPGNYVALCFVTDPVTHKPHAALGMIMPFTVQ